MRNLVAMVIIMAMRGFMEVSFAVKMGLTDMVMMMVMVVMMLMICGDFDATGGSDDGERVARVDMVVGLVSLKLVQTLWIVMALRIAVLSEVLKMLRRRLIVSFSCSLMFFNMRVQPCAASTTLKARHSDNHLASARPSVPQTA